MAEEQRQTRDRARTEAAILSAAERQLADGGFTAFGVNAIARAAGCDKQLIYRYFGGLDGLADAIGRQLAERGRDAAPPPATRTGPMAASHSGELRGKGGWVSAKANLS